MSLPEDRGQSVEEQIEELRDYCYQQNQLLRYVFSNLGAENFNPVAMEEMSLDITKPVRVRLENDEGKLTELTVTLGEVSTQVSAIGENYVTSATLTITAGQIKSEVKAEVADTYATQTSLTQTNSDISAVAGRVTQLEEGGSETVVSSVTLDSNGLHVSKTDGSGTTTTAISGNYIKSGTIEGVDFISTNGSQRVDIAGGMVRICNGNHMIGYMTYYNNALYIFGDALKLNADGNMSIEAQGNTIFLGSTSDTIRIKGTEIDAYIRSVVNAMA